MKRIDKLYEINDALRPIVERFSDDIDDKYGVEDDILDELTHIVANRLRVKDDEDGEEFLREMEKAADEAAAGLPFGGSD